MVKILKYKLHASRLRCTIVIFRNGVARQTRQIYYLFFRKFICKSAANYKQQQHNFVVRLQSWHKTFFRLACFYVVLLSNISFTYSLKIDTIIELKCGLFIHLGACNVLSLPAMLPFRSFNVRMNART